ncbi:hypothetical protein K2173_010421 [Erythroxylum novogranatense]|uniref:Protein kinase domain-containing protein n=1 Tax=Erythroxylum novogranatense TaxID=1862640 RepID=A0AAV8TEU3_9ROSI|nr:hypothetical protein K2173_010421 [Erythroxylum novogranatense]
MPEEKTAKPIEKRIIIVGIQIDGHSRELLSWALVKVAEPGDCVIAVHVCRSSGHFVKVKPLLDSYLEVYGALCSLKKVELTGQISRGISFRKTLVREVKNHSAVAVLVGINNRNAVVGWGSTAHYCAKRLPPTTDVLALHKGKIVFRRCNHNQLTGLCGDPKPSFNQNGSPIWREVHSEFGDSEADTEISSFDVVIRNGSEEFRDETSSLVCERKKRSTSLFAGDILDQRPGWPLLRIPSIDVPKALQSRQLSVVQWVMNLPNRSPQQSPQSLRSSLMEKSSSIGLSAVGELENNLAILLKTNSSTCKWFNYEILKAATSEFFSGNLIGKGGCNKVYKGILPDGKPVAVKIQKSSQIARKDFSQEVGILSSLKHKHITPLLGICLKDNELISIYDLFFKGSLEENLRGVDGNEGNSRFLSWEVRYNIALKIADALTYLHNECPQPVIHRDVKSSNILLSENFEPQLSDFGLAIWGPSTSSFTTEDDVVGTFGYLAPEYFMYGKVSDKIDVYAFGVVLLELLSGRKPIASEYPKDQESLVMWAKPLIESGNTKGILDPILGGNIDEVEVQRMVLAAKLCITRSATRRPKMIEIQKLLREGNRGEKCMNPNKYPEDIEMQGEDDDEVYPNSSAELHMSVALLDIDDDTSLSSLEQVNSISWEGYLQRRWSRSSSFD